MIGKQKKKKRKSEKEEETSEGRIENFDAWRSSNRCVTIVLKQMCRWIFIASVPTYMYMLTVSLSLPIVEFMKALWVCPFVTWIAILPFHTTFIRRADHRNSLFPPFSIFTIKNSSFLLLFSFLKYFAHFSSEYIVCHCKAKRSCVRAICT